MTRTFVLPERLALLVLAAATALAGQDHTKWSDYGGGPDSSHFVNLKQITPANITQLQVRRPIRPGIISPIYSILLLSTT